MLTFVHLSDIHFRGRDHETQFDLDQQVRRALLDDLGGLPHGGAAYDGLLLTGDIAFGGKKSDYDRAKDFLETVFTQTGITPQHTFMVPGNHDIDRSFVEPNYSLWDSHQAIRAATSGLQRREMLHTQLNKDPLQPLLRPLDNYNDFAQGYECDTRADRLAWRRVFEKPLEHSTLLRLHGLNSVIVSDIADAPSNLLVSDFQTTHFEHTSDTVELVLCHHPPDWLVDKQQIREVLDSFVSVGLFGHEHTTRVEATKKHVQLFAGAVQPSRRDPHWLPTYHILELSVEDDGAERCLKVRVHTREFSASRGHRFLPRLNADGAVVDEHRVRARGTAVVRPTKEQFGAANELATLNEVEAPVSDSVSPTPIELPLRELRVHFFRLGTPLRFAAAIEANLLQDGDDTMDPRAMWAAVFQRGIDQKRLTKLWTAVAAQTPSLRDLPNPFNE